MFQNLGLCNIILFSFFIFGSCKSDPCMDIVCGPGVCAEGACVCPEGFTGPSCNVCEDVTFVLPGKWIMTTVIGEEKEILFYSNNTFYSEPDAKILPEGESWTLEKGLKWELSRNQQMLFLYIGYHGSAYQIKSFDCDNIQFTSLGVEGNLSRLEYEEQ